MSPEQMAGSAFDPEKFLEATLSEPSERRPPLPVANPETGDGLYMAVISKVETRVWQSKKPEAKVKSGIAVDVTLDINVPTQLQDLLKKAIQPLTDSVMVNTTDQGTMDNAPGRNPGVKAYRDATDLNKPGDKFNWKMLVGKAVKVKIEHEIYQGAPVDRVAGVLRA